MQVQGLIVGFQVEIPGQELIGFVQGLGESVCQTLSHPFSSISTPLFIPLTKPVKFLENEILKTISSRLEQLDKNKGINNIDEK